MEASLKNALLKLLPKWTCLLAILLLIVGIVSAQDDINGLQVTFDVDSSHPGFTIDDLRTAAEVIAHRLQALDISPYRVQIVNQTSIQVQFPGMDDPQSLIDTLTQTALLEFVDFSGLGNKAQQLVGLDIRTAGHDDSQGQVNPITGKPFETILTGAAFKSTAVVHADGRWEIGFELTDEGAAIFGPYTESHIAEPLAIVFDGRVLSAPTIQAPLDKSGVIVSNFTEQEAKQLAAQLRAGALALPLVVAETATIETIALEKAVQE
jgi:preprotein translocase subunit SecD